MNTTPSSVESRYRYSLAVVAVVAIVIALSANATIADTPTREDAVLVSITATIEALDHETREATLRGPLGNMVSFTVDERVERLAEFKVGDAVTAEYFVSMAYELREPTAAEREAPLVILDAAAKAGDGSSPAAGAVSRIRAVCTIEGLDRPTETATLKGPRGRYATVRVADPANLPHLRIGQSVVVTYTETLAVSLEKVDP
jgi:hypothetical protein